MGKMITVIIAAAGKGTRLNGIPKAFVKLGGRHLIYYSLDTFCHRADEVIIVFPEKYVKRWDKKLKKIYKNIRIVAGGLYRQDSVRNAIDIMANRTGIVLVHDVARPFLSVGLFNRLVEAAEKYGACVPYVGLRDTLKEMKDNFVVRTLDRNIIVGVQTPQAFKADFLRKAYAEAYRKNFYGSDDSVLVEMLGVDVYLVEGEQENIKITYPVDLKLAKIILKQWKTVE